MSNYNNQLKPGADLAFIEVVVFVNYYKTILHLGAVIKTKTFIYILSLKNIIQPLCTVNFNHN